MATGLTVLWIVPVVAVGVFALSRWAKHASNREDEQQERRLHEQKGRAARALDDVAAAPFPPVLLGPIPRAIATHRGQHPELRARMNDVLRNGTLARGVILTVENTTSAEGLGPDEVRLAYRDISGEVMIHTLVGDSWLYRGRPAWCRVRRPVSVLHDAGNVVVFEEVMDDLLVAQDMRASAPQPPEPALAEDRGAVLMRGRPLILRAAQHGLSFTIAPGSNVVMGRTAEMADLVVAEEGVSRRHARFTHEADALYVEDLRSTPGVFVNGARIRALARLHAGDVVQVGIVQFTVVDP